MNSLSKKQGSNQGSLPAEQILGKNLPYSLEAERALLSAVLLQEECLSTILDILTPAEFYLHAHQVIFEAMIGINQASKHVDTITLCDELEKRGQLEKVGGRVFIISLQEDLPSLGLVEQHARMVKDKSVLRSLIKSASHIISSCYSQDEENIDAVLDQAEQVIFQVSQKRTSQAFVQLNIWLRKAFQQISEMKGNNKGITGVPSGYKKLDEMTSGFQKGDFIVLAARPSMGKTALALSLAYNAAEQGKSVGFFSLEMGAEQLTLRLVSAQAQVDHQHIRTGTVTSDEWMSMTYAAAKLAETKFFIDDTPTQSILDIRARARKLKAEHNLDFLVIDYLQLIHSQRKHENRHQEVSEISRSLKALAKELQVPIVALSQLSRAVDSRVDKRPMLSDLRESGAIEQDADVIMFLYRDVVYNQETEHPSLAELIIGKQRNGPTGTVFMNFFRELTLFQDYEGV